MSPEVERHLEVWANRERYEPVAKLEDVLKHAGVPVELIKRHKAPLLRGEKIAAAFEAAPDEADEVIAKWAFWDLANQVDDLFSFVTRDLGYQVEWSDAENPYETAADQARDLRGGHLWTAWGLGGAHPLLSPERYARFRAVHDMFGHAGLGRGFDRHGEYEAWLVHAGMYRGLGAWAMSSEYRGVNCSLTVGQARGAGRALLLPPQLLPELAREGAFELDLPLNRQPENVRY